VTYPTSVPFASRHFHLEQLAEGVYAAISIDGTGSMSNAGIIDLGGTTLIFDTFGTPQAAQDLRTAAGQLLGQPIAYVVNSHRHGDHFWGNQVFHPAATIIATGRTRADILKDENIGREEMQREIENDIRELEAKRAREQNDAKRRSQAVEIATRRELLSTISTFERTLPDLTFEQQLTFHGSQRIIELLTYGGGHTASDAFLYLPADRLLFMGDLLFVAVHPWIGHGSPEEWQAILQRIEQFDFAIAVPGHGPLGSREDLTLNRDYLASCLALADQCMGEGLPLEEATTRKLPAPFDSWEGAEVFDWNMEFLYNRAK
jgi:cyclase